MKHIVIGYAAFMSEAAFKELGIEGDYQSLRLLHARHAPRGSSPSFEPALENSDAWAGGDGSVP